MEYLFCCSRYRHPIQTNLKDLSPIVLKKCIDWHSKNELSHYDVFCTLDWYKGKLICAHIPSTYAYPSERSTNYSAWLQCSLFQWDRDWMSLRSCWIYITQYLSHTESHTFVLIGDQSNLHMTLQGSVCNLLLRTVQVSSFPLNCVSISKMKKLIYTSILFSIHLGFIKLEIETTVACNYL